MRALLVCIASAFYPCGRAPMQGGGGAAPQPQTLAVHSVGSGRIISDPAGIDCGSTCIAEFALLSRVTLTAIPAAGWTLAAFSSGCPESGVCALSIEGPTRLTITFEPLAIPVRTLTVIPSEHGRVTSDPPAIDCPGTCAATLPDGAHLTLRAAANPHYRFLGWAGCEGTTDCVLDVDRDRSVSASFTSAPQALEIVVIGAGNVRSPALVDCDTSCTAEVLQDTSVALAVRAEAGWRFAGYGGACAGEVCAFMMDGAMTVSATFVPAEPVPPGDCAGLVPDLPEPLFVDLPEGPGAWGTSDGNGTLALSNQRSTAMGPFYVPFTFFVVQEGKANATGTSFAWGGETGLAVFPEASGFNVLFFSTSSMESTLATYSHEGTRTAKTTISPGLYVDSTGASPLRAGGVAVAHVYPTTAGSWSLAYQRFESADATASPVEFPLGAGHWGALSPGVDVTGHVLLSVRGPLPDGPAAPANDPWAVAARWATEDGAPLGPWFRADPAAWASQGLLDGSIAMKIQGRFQRVYSYPAMASSAGPDWLLQRADNQLAIVRGGKAYASWGPSGACERGVEILAPSGASCGCVAVPDLTSRASIGRDGSLIVPSQDPAFSTYRVYEALFR